MHAVSNYVRKFWKNINDRQLQKMLYWIIAFSLEWSLAFVNFDDEDQFSQFWSKYEEQIENVCKSTLTV